MPYQSKLDYEIVGKDYPVLVMDNFYNNQQFKEIWHELELYNLNTTRNLWTSNLKDANRAKDPVTGQSLATNERLYLDPLFKHKDASFIFYHCRKLVSKTVMNVYKEMSPPCRNAENVNTDYSMISYYTGGDKYEFHKDRATHTALWWTYKEPKAFSGGNLIFKDGDFEIECKNNRMVMFPSFYLHASSPIELEYANDEEKLGKYTISHFLNINI